MKLMGKKEVMACIGVAERTLENMVDRCDFPPPVFVGKRALWAEDVVEAWLAKAFEGQRNWTSGRARPAAKQK